MSKSSSLKRVKTMRSPFGDQAGKLSNPEVSCLVDPSSRLTIRRPYSSSLQKRYTIRLPSGDQLGNPLFPSVLVSSWSSEPSGRISMTRAGRPRGGKYNPRPNAIQSLWRQSESAFFPAKNELGVCPIRIHYGHRRHRHEARTKIGHSKPLSVVGIRGKWGRVG